MPYSISIVFDANYIEPALLTAFETKAFTQHGAEEIILIYLYEGTVDEESKTVLEAFLSSNQDGLPIRIITVKKDIGEFMRFHFNNSIIYKILTPSFFGDRFILNIDAGICLGNRFGEFLSFIDAETQRPSDSNHWIVKAFCHDPTELIPENLKKLPRNQFYPAATVMLFNGKRYALSSCFNRLLKNYACLHPYLQLAEQELLCLTFESGEIAPLPEDMRGDARFLSLDSLADASQEWPDDTFADCTFFKIVGTIKPWKLWVLDPNKRFYLKRRASLESVFPLSIFRNIVHQRMTACSDIFKDAFLKSYETSLLYRSKK